MIRYDEGGRGEVDDANEGGRREMVDERERG